ncbi:MAG: hypothetical protein ACOCUW_03040 [Gemmatimonadota bacterium]
MRGITIVAMVFLAATPVLVPAQDGADPSRLYGRIVTTDGSRYEGYIRWAGNEAGWFDILHGDKAIPERNRRDAERLGWEPGRRAHRIEIFGIGISWDDDGPGVGTSAASGVRLGHVSTLEPLSSSRARVILKSGEVVELSGGSDVGSSVDLLVEDPGGGQVELDWGDVRVIDLLAAPGSPSVWGRRLYGTLETRDGVRFTGYIVWDMDELFTTDVLDGDDPAGDDREIPFEAIREIRRESSRAARVVLHEGPELLLDGSNDVNDDNRDILVADPALGEVRVEWDALARVVFEDPPGPQLSIFDGGRRLSGTVRARGGETHTGAIRWDNDEEYSWEILDGELRDGVELDIEFGHIRSIERVSDDASRVTLRDGRTFELTDSNDVASGHKGVYVGRPDGTLVLVPWDRFEQLDLET